MASSDYRDRRDKALYWPLVRMNKNTRPVFSGLTIELNVQWVEKKREVIDGATGQKVMTDATLGVDRVIPVGSLMWRGGLDDLSGTSTGTDNMPETGFMRVVTSGAYKEIGARRTRYEVTLVRYSDSIGSIIQE